MKKQSKTRKRNMRWNGGREKRGDGRDPGHSLEWPSFWNYRYLTEILPLLTKIPHFYLKIQFLLKEPLFFNIHLKVKTLWSKSWPHIPVTFKFESPFPGERGVEKRWWWKYGRKRGKKEREGEKKRLKKNKTSIFFEEHDLAVSSFLKTLGP